MDSLKISINKIFKASVKSFSRFPASIISAAIVSIVAILKINMGWEFQKTYSLLLNSIQLSFLLAGVFSMAVVAYGETSSKKSKSFYLLSNISGIVLGIISFLLLYFFGGIVSEEGVKYISNIASLRIGVAVFVSALGFIYIISNAKTVDSFRDSFFIAQKAFVVSSIYGLVIMVGVSGVLGAFQALVYGELSFRVYQYLGVAVGFLTYTMFLGYFPSFSSSEKTSKMKSAEEQPKFIFVLFGYILVPIIIALTLVLFIWSLRVLLTDVDVPFSQLSSIASSYVIIGIWLHLMVSNHNTKLANFYKIAYPFSAMLVLGFQAWSIVLQVRKFGLQTTEYSFIILWIFALTSVVLLIFLKDRAYKKISIVAIVLSIVSVLPFIGFQDVTFNSQISRLEKILIEENLLENNTIVKAEGEVETSAKNEITDAVDFIAYSEKTNTPPWFKENLDNYTVFKDTFGFEKTYGLYSVSTKNNTGNFTLKTELIDISDYPLALSINPAEKMDTSVVFRGSSGEYEIIWSNNSNGIPEITVSLEGKTIINKGLKDYLDNLLLKYPLDEYTSNKLPFEDMSLLVEGEDLSLLVVFDAINIYYYEPEEKMDYYISIHGLYIKEK